MYTLNCLLTNQIVVLPKFFVQNLMLILFCSVYVMLVSKEMATSVWMLMSVQIILHCVKMVTVSTTLDHFAVNVRWDSCILMREMNRLAQVRTYSYYFFIFTFFQNCHQQHMSMQRLVFSEISFFSVINKYIDRVIDSCHGSDCRNMSAFL